MKILNYLTSHITKITAAFMMISVLIVSSCKDDEEAPPIATVQFATTAQTVSESGVAIVVSITFDKEAGSDGTITVTATEGAETDYGTHYSTNPNGSSGSFDIAVSEGQTSAQFTFTPVNNALLHDDKSVEFTISDVSKAFEIGTQDSDMVTITDDEGPTQANFGAASSSTAENLTEGTDVTISLSSAAPGTGSVTISFTSATAAYTTNFTTEPAATAGSLVVPVAQSATSVTFKVKPVDDGNVNANRVISFSITAASGAVVAGTALTTHMYTITDNETPSVATFTSANSSIGESETAGMDIPITLDPQTNGTGTIVVSFAGATYGDDFTTDPAAAAGQLTVNVGTGVTSASFKVIPTDDSDVSNDRVITYTLSSSTGIVTIGGANTTHEVTIEEDDAITTIADVRAMYSGSNVNITSPLRIQGIVTSINDNINTNNVWVQDATGGIVVRFVNANNNTIARGDEVLIQLNGGQLTEFNGLRQVQNVPNGNASIIDNNNALPTPEVITVAQFVTGSYEGKLVRINDVHFPDADGIITMSGNRTISDGTTTTVRTEPGASFSAQLAPLGVGTVTGLAGDFTTGPQLIPQVFADDIFANSPVGTIAILGTINDFGSVNNGAESTSQQYTLQGTTLTSDVVITASTGFKVSTDDATFTSSVTIPSVTANAAAIIYVKFAPTSGADGVINGTITNKSIGAVTQSIPVSGTESGNGVAPLQTLALWTFEVSLPSSTGAVSADLNAESGLLAGATAIAKGVHTSASTVYSNPAGNGSAESFSSNFWGTDDYYQFSLNSTGRSDIAISWDQTRSGTGPSAFALYYSTDGTNFTKHADYTVIQGTWAAAAPILTTSHAYELSSITALNNSATLVFRLVQTGTGIATAGTNRVDNVKVEGR